MPISECEGTKKNFEQKKERRDHKGKAKLIDNREKELQGLEEGRKAKIHIDSH